MKSNLEEVEEHLDPTSEISLEAIKKRAVRGVAVLTGRTFLLSVLSLIATGLLTVFLSPSDFGIFFVVSAVVNFLSYFSDVGLAAALIQKKERLDDKELNTTFLIQQILVISLLVLLFLFTPFLQNYYSLGNDAKFLLYALGISLFLSSLKTIPSVILERELEFGKLVIPQVIENVTYNVLSVFLAWKGLGVNSFSYAILARGLFGLIAIYILKPWIPRLTFSKGSLKRLLSFGLPYQTNTFLATIKDDGLTAYLGGILGTSGVGFLGWAQKWAQYPLRLFMDHVLKVTFPAFSRMQDHKEELLSSVTKSIFFVCFLVYPTLVGLLIVAPLLINLIPRYSKWEPALIPLSLVSVNVFFAAATTQLTNVLNAIGKIKTTFKLMVMWTALSWLFIPYLSVKYGINGAAFGYSLVGASSVIAIYIVRKVVKFSLYKSIFTPAIASVCMGSVLLFLRRLLPVNYISLWVLVITGVGIYLFVMYLLAGRTVWFDAKRGIKAIFSRG